MSFYFVIGLMLNALVIGVFVWTRFAIVSLNKDIRILLDRQSEIRARLDRLEALELLPEVQIRTISLQ